MKFTQPVIAQDWTGRILVPAHIANKIVDGVRERITATHERWTLPDGSVVPGLSLTWVTQVMRDQLRVRNIGRGAEVILKALGFRVVYDARNSRNQRAVCVTLQEEQRS